MTKKTRIMQVATGARFPAAQKAKYRTAGRISTRHAVCAKAACE